MRKYSNEEKESLKNINGTKSIGLDNEEFIPFFNTNPTDPIEIYMIGKTLPTKNYSIFRKEADVSVIELILDGEGYVDVNGTNTKVSKGDLIYLKRGMRHFYKSSNKNPYKKIWINFRSDILDSLAEKIGLIDSVVSHNVEAESYFNNLFSYAENPDNVQNIPDYFFSTIVNIILLTRVNVDDNFMGLAIRVKSALDSAVYSSKNINNICDELHFSRQHITKVFSTKFCVSPLQYLLDAKIKAAKTMLKNTNTPIKIIYRTLGFTSQSYFSSLFRSKTGLKPIEYRNKYRVNYNKSVN